MTPVPAIELSHVTKIYRRYGGRHFATLKSALLQRSLMRDLQPRETFQALDDVTHGHDVTGFDAAAHLAEHQRLRPGERAALGQLRQHPIDPVRPLVHVLEKQHASFGRVEGIGSAE